MVRFCWLCKNLTFFNVFQLLGVSIRWAFFAPDKAALVDLTKLVEDGKLKPVVDSVFNFEQTPSAYSKMKSGHARGKQIIDMAKSDSVSNVI